MEFFSMYSLYKVLENQRNEAAKYIDNLNDDEVMSNSEVILIDNGITKFEIDTLDVKEEDYSKRVVKQGKVKRFVEPFWRGINGKEYVDVDGYSFTFFYPFKGDKELFKCQPSTVTLSAFRDFSISGSFIVIKKSLFADNMKSEQDKERLMSEVKREFQSFLGNVMRVNNEITPFNSGLRDLLKKELDKRKNRMNNYFDIAKMFEVKVDKSEEVHKQIKTKKRIAPISHKYNKEDNYYISSKEYNEILFTIKHNCMTYERTPTTFQGLHEEDLRNLILAALNGVYLGTANGEAFRNKGKTDICIEKQNRAAFVAECKIWRGPGKVEEDILQLDSYLTWRDCKTALIYFVRNKDFLSVIKTIGEKLNDFPLIRRVELINGNEFACQYVSDKTPGQIINLRVQLFNLYTR
jgi:hypothetical protein